MNGRNIEKIKNNKKIKDSDKNKIFNLFDKASKISFGKISPRLDGYLFEEKGYPRCTSIMSMDGTKAGALMEWAKREIIDYAKEELYKKLNELGKLDNSTITSILDNALNCPDMQRDEAANKGTNVHNNIENWLNGEPFEDNESLHRFMDIWEKEKVELVCTELPIIYIDKNTNQGFGGRLDILAYKDGEFIIYDNKTSKSVHQGYALQVASYKAGVEQMSEDDKILISKAKIIHLPDLSSLKKYQKDAYEKLGSLIDCKNLDVAFEHYKILLNQYYNRNNKYF